MAMQLSATAANSGLLNPTSAVASTGAPSGRLGFTDPADQEMMPLMYNGPPGGAAAYMQKAQEHNRKVANAKWNKMTGQGQYGQQGGGTPGQPGYGQLGSMPTGPNGMPMNLGELATFQFNQQQGMQQNLDRDFAAGTGALGFGRYRVIGNQQFQDLGGQVSALQKNSDIWSEQDVASQIGAIGDASAKGAQQLTGQLSGAFGAAGGAGGGGAIVGALADSQAQHQDRMANTTRQLEHDAKLANRQGLMQSMGAASDYANQNASFETPWNMAMADANFNRRYAPPDMSGYAQTLGQMGAAAGGMGGTGQYGGGDLFNTPEMMARDRDLLIAQATNTMPAGFGSDITGLGGSAPGMGGGMDRLSPGQGGGSFGGFGGSPQAQGSWGSPQPTQQGAPMQQATAPGFMLGAGMGGGGQGQPMAMGPPASAAGQGFMQGQGMGAPPALAMGPPAGAAGQPMAMGPPSPEWYNQQQAGYLPPGGAPGMDSGVYNPSGAGTQPLGQQWVPPPSWYDQQTTGYLPPGQLGDPMYPQPH